MNYYIATIKTKIHSIFSTTLFHTVLCTNMILFTYFQSKMDISYINYCSQMFCWFFNLFFLLLLYLEIEFRFTFISMKSTHIILYSLSKTLIICSITQNNAKSCVLENFNRIVSNLIFANYLFFGTSTTSVLLSELFIYIIQRRTKYSLQISIDQPRDKMSTGSFYYNDLCLISEWHGINVFFLFICRNVVILMLIMIYILNGP